MHNPSQIRIRWLAPVILLAAVVASANAQVDKSAGNQSWMRQYEAHSDEVMPYRLMKPFALEEGKLYPVIVSLHGGAGRGTDNRRQLRIWTRHLADEATRKRYPSYVLAPQSERLWDGEHLEKIKAIVSKLPAADQDRVYVLGHSMGGHGSFILLQIDPTYFAAAAPSAGTGRSTSEEFIDASLIKDVPIWAFHGDRDEVCPHERAEELFAEMEQLGGNMKLTTWAGDGHSVGAKLITGGDNGTTKCSSDRCNSEPELLRWLFSHSRSAE